MALDRRILIGFPVAIILSLFSLFLQAAIIFGCPPEQIEKVQWNSKDNMFGIVVFLSLIIIFSMRYLLMTKPRYFGWIALPVAVTALIVPIAKVVHTINGWIPNA